MLFRGPLFSYGFYEHEVETDNHDIYAVTSHKFPFTHAYAYIEDITQRRDM